MNIHNFLLTASASVILTNTTLNAQSPSLPPLEEVVGFRVQLPDITGDGIPDVLLSRPLASDARGELRLISGATVGDTPYRTLSGGKGDSALGIACTSCGDIDQDGYPDIAAFVLSDDVLGDARVVVFSSASGKSLVEILPIKDAAQCMVGLRVVDSIDINKDGVVDTQDLIEIVNDMGSNGTVGYVGADVDKSGETTAEDIAAFYDKFFNPTSYGTVALSNLVSGLLPVSPCVLPEEIAPLTPHGPNDFNPNPMALGPGGCLKCFWNCGKEIRDTKKKCLVDWFDNCVAQMLAANAHRGRNYSRFDAESDCYAMRVNFISRCLTETAETMGECGKCITKCIPKPTL